MLINFKSLLVVISLGGVFCILNAANAANVERIFSPSGIEIWYVQEPSIPVISLSIGFSGGSALDPKNKQGLARLAVALLDEGAGDLDDKNFQSAVVDNSIDLKFRVGRDMIRVSLRTLSKNRTEAFKLLGVSLREPRFDSAALKRVKNQLISSINSDQMNPNSIAIRRWFEVVFGEHPYAKPVSGNVKGLSAVDRSDLLTFVKERITKSKMVIGASGDIPGKEFALLIDKALSKLPVKGRHETLMFEDVNPTEHYEVIKMAIPQSVAVFGLKGLRRNDQDFYAAYVMNYILGGSGFTSRLYKEIRENRGLAYSVYSYLHPMEHEGLILGGVATRNDAISQSLGLIRKELNKMSEFGVSESELSNAKQGITGSFPLRFDSGQSIAAMLVSMQFEGLGIDYIDNRNKYIDQVTVHDIQSVARRLIEEKPFVTIIVGSPSGMTDIDKVNR